MSDETKMMSKARRADLRRRFGGDGNVSQRPVDLWVVEALDTIDHLKARAEKAERERDEWRERALEVEAALEAGGRNE